MIIISKIYHFFCFFKKKSDDIIIISVVGIGDAALCSGYVQEIYKKYPERSVSLFCFNNNYDFAVNTNLYKNIYVWDYSLQSIISKLKFMITLLNISCNDLIMPFLTPPITTLTACTLIKAKNKYVSITKGKKSYLLDKVKLSLIFNFCIDSSFNILDSMRLVFSKALNTSFDYSFFDVRKIKSDYNCDSLGKYFVIAPGASSPLKIWPIKNFLAVAEYIYQKTKWNCVIIGGGKNDNYSSNWFLEHFQGNAVNLVNCLNVIESGIVISKAKLVLCNDSSIFHLSVGSSVPTFVIPWRSEWNYYLPYPQSVKNIFYQISDINCSGCKLKDDFPNNLPFECQKCYKMSQPLPCVKGISVEQVIKSVNSYLIQNIVK